MGVGAGAEMRRPALISVHALHVHFSGLCAGGGFSEAAPFPSERAAGAFFLEEVALEAAGPTSLGALASSSLLSAGKASAPQLPALSFWNDLVGGLSRLPRWLGSRLAPWSQRTWQKRTRGSHEKGGGGERGTLAN